MNKPEKTVIDGKKIAIYKNADQQAPVVFANMYMEAGKAVLDACETLGCRPFHLVSITNLRWNEELSPWAHAPVVTKEDHFTGEADQYIRVLTEQIIPFAEQQIGSPSSLIIAGYSMGGLLALYAPYITGVFSAAVSASGSVWYPDFVSYARNHQFIKDPDAIYLSLGDRESRTRNQYLKQTEHCMEELCAIYREQGIRSVFELNPGNHYKDAALRLAKGITWVLKEK
ncbi:MAG: alpha/beta hydrolase [Eubacteriaceae bacterium]|jgi:predicted alpha/beta superfamily hydrolase